MSWLYKFLGGLLSGVLSDYLSDLWSAIRSNLRLKKNKEISDENAKAVETTADEIKRLIKEGKEVPQELKDKLREEARRLIDGTFDPNKHS